MKWMRPDRRDLLQRVMTLSQRRVAKHGPPPEDETVWWRQLTDIANDAGIVMPTREQWHEARNQDAWERPL